MKKYLFAISAFLLIICYSCNNEMKKDEASGMSEKARKNLEASHVISDAFESGDPSKIDSVVSEDFVDHTDRGDMNRDSLKAMIKMVHATNKDMKMEIIKELADDEYVFSWMRFTGTSDGSMMPAGPYDMKAMQAVRFRDGMAVEHWEFMEMRDMMKMMQDMQKPAADTAKKK